MRERFIKVRDIVYWIDIDRYTENKPVYKVAKGYYLCSYAMSTYSKCICTGSLTSCVVRHIDPQYVFTDETEAIKMVDVLNKNGKEV